MADFQNIAVAGFKKTGGGVFYPQPERYEPYTVSGNAGQVIGFLLEHDPPQAPPEPQASGWLARLFST